MGTKLEEIQLAEISRRFQLRKQVPKERGAEVVESIKRHGVLQPPRVDAKRQLLLGDVQVWAARKAGLATIAAIVEEQEATEVDALRLMLAEDTQSVPLKPSEKCQGFKRLMELAKCSAGEAAASVGASSASVAKLFAATELEPEFQELLDAGRLGVSKAYELSLMKPEERLALLPAIQQGQLSRDDLIAARKLRRERTREASQKPSKRVRIVLEGGHTITVQGDALDLEGYIDAIGKLFRRAKQAHARGLLLCDFAKAAKHRKAVPS